MKKILIVDDEKEIRDLLKEKLTHSDYKVKTAADGQEAFALCKINPPDLILLDIAMPQMDGYAVCEKIKQDPKLKDIPILFLTGKDLEPTGILERCGDLGAAGHISKLSTLKELLDRVKETIG
ncbi:MAG: response regulator [Candidatus Omnitrophica bacterium]|nr:response regulator [Candidatus Omnitrophota bacterium]